MLHYYQMKYKNRILFGSNMDIYCENSKYFNPGQSFYFYNNSDQSREREKEKERDMWYMVIVIK